MRLNRLIGEVSGAFADLGTFLPLIVVGAELAFSRRLFEARLDCLPAILATAVVRVAVNVAVGPAAGLAVEIARAAVAKVFGRARPQ